MFVHTPTRIANLFNLNKKATAKPVKVCSPKKGEKPRKIPMEKARAVRSGVS